MAPRQQLTSIQTLRGVAAGSVVFFHAATTFSGPNILSQHYAWGAAGVDVFFVISGFIMVLTSRSARPAEFMWRRFARIVPIYWLLTIAMVAAVAFGLSSAATLEAGHTLASFAFVPFANPVSGQVHPVLYVGWTLNYEMFFYAIFAAALLFRRRLFSILVAIIVGLVALGLAVDGPFAFEFYTNPIMLEFVAGALIARLYLLGYRLPPAVSLALVLLGGLAIVAWSSEPGLRAFWWGVPAVFIVAGMALNDRPSVSSSATAAALGDASYSIYLTHILVLPVLVRVFPPFRADVLAFVAMAICLLVGWAFYRLVERRLVLPRQKATPSGVIASGSLDPLRAVDAKHGDRVIITDREVSTAL